MEFVYKMFHPGMICRGMRFTPGVWATETEANCKRNGLHAAKNPLDCLTYYASWDESECWICQADGDIDEDEIDSKISCTRLRPVRRLNLLGFVNMAMDYIVKHPQMPLSCHVKTERGEAGFNHFAIVRGRTPRARGGHIGDVLGLIKTGGDGMAEQIGLYVVGDGVAPGAWIDVEGREVKDADQTRLHGFACGRA